MKEIIEYKLVTETDPALLQDAVNALLEQGFQPFGSFSSVYSSDEERIRLYQPMVKTEMSSP